VESFLPTVTFYALKVQKTPIWQRVAGAPPWGLTLRFFKIDCYNTPKHVYVP